MIEIEEASDARVSKYGILGRITSVLSASSIQRFGILNPIPAGNRTTFPERQRGQKLILSVDVRNGRISITVALVSNRASRRISQSLGSGKFSPSFLVSQVNY